MKSRARVLVSGDVQGVFFRSKTRDTAVQLGLTGFVRNLPDGRVEAVFEGEDEKVKKAVEFCREGPPGSTVRDIRVEEEDFKGEFSRFDVKH